jgi:hypothetical protein
MGKNGNQLFRQQVLDQMSSPEELNDYLKVTNPGVWAVLAAIILLLLGLLAWACVGTLQTKADAKVIIKKDAAAVVVPDPYTVNEGMRVTVESQEYPITSMFVDEYGRTVGMANMALPDGTYEGTVVVEETHAIDFLLQSS